jgi:hypothetical protein
LNHGGITSAGTPVTDVRSGASSSWASIRERYFAFHQTTSRPTTSTCGWNLVPTPAARTRGSAPAGVGTFTAVYDYRRSGVPARTPLIGRLAWEGATEPDRPR